MPEQQQHSSPIDNEQQDDDCDDNNNNNNIEESPISPRKLVERKSFEHINSQNIFTTNSAN